MKKMHGKSKTKIYHVWSGMLRRCNNPKSKAYKNYGGRGIAVCSEWHDFLVFKKWALSHGYDESLQIDRINNDGNYEPSNCRFVTRSINHQNRRKRKDFCIYKRNYCSTYYIIIDRRPNRYMRSAKTIEEAREIRDKLLKTLI